MRHDRLSGLAQLALIAGGPRILCRGVPDTVVAALAERDVDVCTRADAERAPVDSAVLVATSSRAAADTLATANLSPTAVIWLLFPTGSTSRAQQAARSAGLHVLGRFGVLNEATSPTHLVRTDLPEARSWFADSIRASWSTPGRVARRLGRTPLVAPWGFTTQALLLAGRQVPPGWPLPADGRCAVPVAVGLGGGPTAGRSVLTYGDAQGRPVRHVKLEPTGPVPARPRESQVLTLLGEVDTLAGSVPSHLGDECGPGWAAFAQSHLAGTTLDRRWERNGARHWERDVTEVLDWLARFAGMSGSLAESRLAATDPIHPPTGLPEDLRAAIARGARLASSARRLVHGDLWPGNVVRGPSGIGVLDWESASAGHPLTDTLTFLLTATRCRLPAGSTIADAGVAALADHRSAAGTGAALRRVLAAVGQADLPPSELDDLVVCQLHEVARRPAPGGLAEANRCEMWLDCLRAVWERWHLAGGSPWGGAAANQVLQ